MGEKNKRIIQILIAVLSAVLSFCLILLLSTVLLRHLYGDSGTSVTDVNTASPHDTPLSDVAITLSGNQAESVTAFSLKNLLPGKKETKSFYIQVSYRKQLFLCCDATVCSDNDLADRMYATIRLPSTGEELYDGPIKEMPCLSYELQSASKATENITYEVSLYLDPDADNAYQDMEFEAEFRWWAQQPENLSSPRHSDVVKALLCISLVMTVGLVAIVLIEDHKSREGKRYA